MAKPEEGDARWIVQDRGKEGTNVNAWHWVEKDMTDWSRRRLDELFAGQLLLDGDGFSLKCTGLESLSGDAFLNVRKGKLIPAYELELKVRWEGTVDGGEQLTGKLHFPYIADENHDEDTEIKVLCDTATPAQDKLKAQVLSKSKKAIQAVIDQFVKELREGGSERPGAQAITSKPPAAAAAATAAASAPTAANGASSSSAGASGAAAAAASSSKPDDKKKSPATASDTYTLNLTEKFFARPQDIYDCFTVEGRVCAYTQSKATVEARPGGKIVWFGGSVQGEFVEMEPGKRLLMKWRFSNWQDDYYSKVELKISEPEPGNTILTLTHTGIPHYDKFGNTDVLSVTEKGWKAQVLQRIRQVFGYGV